VTLTLAPQPDCLGSTRGHRYSWHRISMRSTASEPWRRENPCRQRRSGDGGVVIDEEGSSRKVEDAQHLVLVLVEEIEDRDDVLGRNVWRRREVDQDLFERRWSLESRRAIARWRNAPAGVTAPAMGRQARMDTSSSRRAFILDPLCRAARCETRHEPRAQTRWPPASCGIFAHISDEQTSIRGGYVLGPE
jgi:hypothetical protein